MLESDCFIITDKMNSVFPCGHGFSTDGNSDTPMREKCLEIGVEPAAFYYSLEAAKKDLKKYHKKIHKYFKILKIEVKEVKMTKRGWK